MEREDDNDHITREKHEYELQPNIASRQSISLDESLNSSPHHFSEPEYELDQNMNASRRTIMQTQHNEEQRPTDYQSLDILNPLPTHDFQSSNISLDNENATKPTSYSVNNGNIDNDYDKNFVPRKPNNETIDSIPFSQSHTNENDIVNNDNRHTGDLGSLDNSNQNMTAQSTHPIKRSGHYTTVVQVYPDSTVHGQVSRPDDQSNLSSLPYPYHNYTIDDQQYLSHQPNEQSVDSKCNKSEEKHSQHLNFRPSAYETLNEPTDKVINEHVEHIAPANEKSKTFFLSNSASPIPIVEQENDKITLPTSDSKQKMIIMDNVPGKINKAKRKKYVSAQPRLPSTDENSNYSYNDIAFLPMDINDRSKDYETASSISLLSSSNSQLTSSDLSNDKTFGPQKQINENSKLEIAGAVALSSQPATNQAGNVDEVNIYGKINKTKTKKYLSAQPRLPDADENNSYSYNNAAFLPIDINVRPKDHETASSISLLSSGNSQLTSSDMSNDKTFGPQKQVADNSKQEVAAAIAFSLQPTKNLADNAVETTAQRPTNVLSSAILVDNIIAAQQHTEIVEDGFMLYGNSRREVLVHRISSLVRMDKVWQDNPKRKHGVTMAIILFLLAAVLLLRSMLLYFILTITPFLTFRYTFSGIQLSILNGMSKVGFIACVLFVGHFGHRMHKPVGIFFGCLAVIGGSVLCATINFVYTGITSQDLRNLTDYYDMATCFANGTYGLYKAQCNALPQNIIQASNLPFSLLCLAQVIIGAGSSFVIILGIVYLHDMATERKAPLHIGKDYMLSILLLENFKWEQIIS